MNSRFSLRPPLLGTRGTIAAALLIVAATAHAGALQVQRRISIGGEGGWDCVTFDAARHRLFVTHGTLVEVVDLDSNRVVGQIPGTPGVHGVALAPEFNCGFTSNGRDSSVTVFDLGSLAVLARIPIPARNPDAIVYDAFSKRVFTFNGGSDNATAIDAQSRTVVGSVALGGKPEFPVVDGAGKLYVNLEDSSAVVEFDTRTLAPLARMSLAPGEEPSGLAFDRAHHRLFSACSNQKLIVLDSETGKFIAEVPIGKGPDGAEFDDSRALVLVPNGADSSLSVIREKTPDDFEIVETVATERGARTLALDRKSGRVYLPTADFGPPPAPTADRPHPRASIVPGTFRVLVVGR
ncbi:MAG: YncE family protein [Candidatus Eiseniibacteriota bacterium]